MYEDWMKFGAVRGIIGTLLVVFIILLFSIAARSACPSGEVCPIANLDLAKVFIGAIIATVILAGLYGLYAYLLSDTFARNGIEGWKALAVIAALVGMTSGVITLLLSYPPADMTSPGTAIAYSYEFMQPLVNSSVASTGVYATLSVEEPQKDVITVMVSSIIGEVIMASIVAGLYRIFGAKLPEVA